MMVTLTRGSSPLPASLPGQLVTTVTVTVAPLGLNTRCTCIWPGPVAVIMTVVLAPAASVPDMGATVTFLARPGASETDQATVPPEAVSVSEPLAGGTTSSVAGLTLSVPTPCGALVVVVAGADTGAGAAVCPVTAVGGVLPPAPRLAVGKRLAFPGTP